MKYLNFKYLLIYFSGEEFNVKLYGEKSANGLKIRLKKYTNRRFETTKIR